MDALMISYMGSASKQAGRIVRHVMVRVPEPEVDILEEEAKSKGTTLAAYCRELLIDHVKNRNKIDNVRPIVRDVIKDILKSEDLYGEFSEKVAKALAKKYQ